MKGTITKNISQEIGFLNYLRPLMKRLLTPLAKRVLIPLGLSAEMSTADVVIQ